MPLIFGRDSAGRMFPILVDNAGRVEILGPVTLSAALPAGNNNIGDVDVASIAAGNNNIGDVDVASLPALPAGANEIGLIQARNYGRYSGAWQKNPLIFGYGGAVAQAVSNTALAAGANSLDFTTPAAGRLFIYTALSFNYVGTVAAVTLTLQIISGGVGPIISYVAPPVSGTWYTVQGWWPVLNPDFIRLNIGGATLNDDANLRGYGFYMDLNL